MNPNKVYRWGSKELTAVNTFSFWLWGYDIQNQPYRTPGERIRERYSGNQNLPIVEVDQVDFFDKGPGRF